MPPSDLYAFVTLTRRGEYLDGTVRLRLDWSRLFVEKAVLKVRQCADAGCEGAFPTQERFGEGMAPSLNADRLAHDLRQALDAASATLLRRRRGCQRAQWSIMSARPLPQSDNRCW
jgi:hypothetical protein